MSQAELKISTFLFNKLYNKLKFSWNKQFTLGRKLFLIATTPYLNLPEYGIKSYITRKYINIIDLFLIKINNIWYLI